MRNPFGDTPVDAALSPERNPFGDSPVDSDLAPTPGIHQLVTQNQPALDEIARTLAQGAIRQREAGTELVKTDNGDGTFTYTPQQTSPPAPLLPGQKQAIIEAYAQEYAGQAPNQQSMTDAANLVRYRTAQDNSALQNFSGAAADTMARMGTGVVGAVAPKTANELNQGLGYTYDPETKAGFAGQVVGNALPLVPAVLAGPAGAATLANVTAGGLGVSQFGSVRADVAQRRQQGEQISLGDELLAAGLSAAAEFVGERVGLGSITAVQKATLKNAVANALFQYAKTAGINASEEAVTQIAQNAVERHVLGSDVDYTEGVGRSAAAGGIIGIGGRALRRIGNPGGTPPPAGPQPYGFAQPVSPQAQPTPEGVGIPVEAAGNLNTIPLAGERVADPNSLPLTPQERQASPQETFGPAEGPTLPALLQESTPKHRVQDGAESRGIPLEFQSAIDKALYVAGQPRKGKLQAEAIKFLADQNVDMGEVSRVREAVDQLAISSPKGAAVLQVPQVHAKPQTIPFAQPTSAERAAGQVPLETTNVPQSKLPPMRLNSPGFSSVQNAPVRQTDSQNSVAPVPLAGESVQGTPPRQTATPVGPSRVAEQPVVKPGEKQGRLFLPSPEIIERASQGINGFKVRPPQNARQAEASRAFKKAGVNVVFFDSTDPIGGFRDRDAPGVIFVNSKRVNEGLRDAVSHEFMHEMRVSRPAIFADFMATMTPAMRQEARAEYARMFREAMPDRQITDAKLDEEAVTLTFGRLVESNPRVWKAALGQNPTMLQRMLDFFREFAAKFSTKAKMVNEAIKTFERILENPLQQQTISTPTSVAQRQAALPSQPVTKTTPQNRYVIPSTERIDFLPPPNERVRAEAQEYTQQAGIHYVADNEYAEVDEKRAGQIADWYDTAVHNPEDPAVQASYDAMKKETVAQWKFLESKGVKFESWKGEGQPYANSQEVLKDVADNKHLYFFTGGDLPSDHPLAEKAPVGEGLVYNDVFRAVHDYFGHAKEGVGFGPRGEENAWRSHSQMYSELARKAMSTETRGQNSWVNYGPYGEQNRKNPVNTRYADQKAVLLPTKWIHLTRPGQVADLKKSGDALANTLRATAADFLPDVKPKGKKDADALKAIRRYLTDAEIEDLSDKDKKRALKLYKQLPPVKQFSLAAKAGEAARGWYERATATLVELFGEDAPQFIRLLAATSPRQQVKPNLVNALEIWKTWNDKGRPTDPAEIRTLLEQPISEQEGLFGSVTEGTTVGRMSTRFPNIIRALSGNEALSGPKVTSFNENLGGNRNHVTNDTWMAQFGDVDQKEFATQAGYVAYTAKVREAAQQLGWEPAEVQETVWSFFKTLADSVGPGRTAKQVLQTLTHEQVGNAPAFHTLLEDKDVVKRLTAAGFSSDGITRSKNAGKEAGPKSKPEGRAVPRLTEDLLDIAKRADKYARRGPGKAKSEDAELEFLPAPLRSDGAFPEDVAQANAARVGDIASEQKRAQFATANLNRAIRQDFGIPARKLDAAQVEQINEALKGRVPLSTFKPATATAIQAMRDHVDSLTTKMMGTSLVDPRLATILGDNLGEYLNRSYRVFDDPKWAAKIPEPVMANAIRFVESQLASQGKSPTLAPIFIDELLQDWKNGGVDSLFSRGKVGSKNLAILKSRKNIAPEIRALMGEYNNPFVNYVKSVSKMSSLLANHQFLESIKASGTGNWLFTDDTAKPGFTTRIAAEESSSMAPLNGMRTSPEIIKAFNSMYSSQQMPGWARVLLTANYIAKSSKTVFSLMTQMRNLIGQPYFNLLNGHFRINKYGQSFKALAADLRSKGDAGMQTYIQELAKYGIIGQGVHASEIMGDLKDMGLADVDMYSEAGFLPTLKRGAKAALKVPAVAYQVSDHLGKIYGFENELARSREINPTFTDEQHKKWASERVLNTYPTYSKIPPAIQKLRRQPFVGPFVAFWYESMRTAGNSVIYAYQDLAHGKNVAQKRAGAERLAGLAVVAGGSLAAAEISKALLGMGDDEEEGFRQFLPEWSKGNTFIFTAKDDKGNIQYIDLSSLNPYSNIIDSLGSLVGGDEDPMVRLSTAVTEFFNPLLSEAIFTKSLREVASNKRDSGSRIYNPEDDLVNQWEDVLGHLFESIEPGTLQRVRERILPGLQGQETSYGDKINPKEEIGAELTGIKLRSFNFSSGLSFQARAFKEAGGNISSLFLREITRPGTVNREDVLEAYTTMEERRFKQWQDLYDKAQSAKKAGLDVREIYSSLLRGGIGPETAKSIIVGRYEPYSLKSSAIKEAVKQHGSDLPLKEMATLYREQLGKTLAPKE